MSTRDLEQFRGELIQLIEKQIETLAKQACDNITDAEFREYDRRKKRIDELYEALHNLDSAA
jgi:DNA anti-recombination protein RmuC